jgi:hypothetical protein
MPAKPVAKRIENWLEKRDCPLIEPARRPLRLSAALSRSRLVALADLFAGLPRFTLVNVLGRVLQLTFFPADRNHPIRTIVRKLRRRSPAITRAIGRRAAATNRFVVTAVLLGSTLFAPNLLRPLFF